MTGPQTRGAAVQTANEGIETFMADITSSSNMAGHAMNTDFTPPSMRILGQQHSSSQRHNTGATALYNHKDDKLDISPENRQTRKDLLRDAFFTQWKDDASSADLGDPGEMQKNDPLGTMVWKLYSKTKTQLPNQERMENLTWRMMAMNLKRKEREQARFVQVTLSS